MARPYAVEAFAGAGLLGFGFNVEGFNVAQVCERNHNAVKTLRANYPSERIAVCDADDWKPHVPKGGIDLFRGGPPCQPTSTAGAGLGEKDPRHKFPLLLQWAKKYKPRYMVWENAGVLGKKHRGWLKRWWADMGKLGYEGVAWHLLAADYGTPQARKRVFLVLWRKGDKRAAARLAEPPPKTHAHPGEAEELGLPVWTTGHSRLHAGCCGRYALYSCAWLNNDENRCSTCIQGDNYAMSQNEEWGEPEKIYEYVNARGQMELMPGPRRRRSLGTPWRPPLDDDQLDYILRDPARIKKHVPADMAGQLEALPRRWFLAPTMTANMDKGVPMGLVIESGAMVRSVDELRELLLAQKAAPGTPGLRFLSVRETAKLQDCPQGYVFRGTLNSQYRQVGNAVPVNLARAVARHVLWGMGRRLEKGSFAKDPFSGLWPLEAGDQRCVFAYHNSMRLQGHEVAQMELLPAGRVARRGTNPPQAPASIELKCGLIEHPKGDLLGDVGSTVLWEQQRWEETQAQWGKAQGIADRLGFQTNIDQRSVQKGVCHMDAYLYPPLDKLESTLELLEAAEVEFDNIDLPPGTPSPLRKRVEDRFGWLADVN